MNKIITSFILASIFIANANASQYSKEIFAKTIAAELKAELLKKQTEKMKQLEFTSYIIHQFCREIAPVFQEQFIDCMAYPEDTNCAKERIKLDRFTRACNKAETIRKKNYQDWQIYLQNKTL